MSEQTNQTRESVRAAVAALPMSRELLAHVMGVTTKTVDRRLAGERDFRLCELIAIARYLEAPIESLMGAA